MPIPEAETPPPHGADVAVPHHRLGRTVAAAVIDALDQVDPLGRFERVELGEAAAQPDLADPRFDELDGYQPTALRMMPGFDDQMRDRPRGRVEDGADDLATRTIRAACLSPEGELCRHGPDAHGQARACHRPLRMIRPGPDSRHHGPFGIKSLVRTDRGVCVPSGSLPPGNAAGGAPRRAAGYSACSEHLMPPGFWSRLAGALRSA